MRGDDRRELATVRHVSASGRLDSFWEWDPQRRLLLGRVKLASARPVDLEDVFLCTEARPRKFAWTISALSADSWLVHPTRYDATEVRRPPTPFWPSGPIGFLVLSSAPDVVAEELRAL